MIAHAWFIKHVRQIVEVSSLRDGTGKELQVLHDTVVQHLRVLKALGHEPSKEFITSLLELKLDSVTCLSQEHNDVADCDELLRFIDLRAQAAEATTVDKKPLQRALRKERTGAMHRM